MALRVRLHVSSHGNLFMTEIALLLQAALDDLGAETQLVADALPGAEPGWCNLVVAPHEFFPLADGTDEQRLDAASRSVVVTTEQPGTKWYETGRAYASVARGVLDINQLAVDELNDDGIGARRLRLGYHESWDRWRGADRARTHDVVFMGSLSRSRDARLARLGCTLSFLDCRLLVHDGNRPVTHAAPNFVWGDEKFDLLADSKILLNLHRADTPYMEWHRVLGALANGCAVLTDPSESSDPLVPYEHFFTSAEETFGDVLLMLVATPELVAKVARSAYDYVRAEYRMVDLLRPFLDELGASAGHRGANRSQQRAIARELDTLPEVPDPRRPAPAPQPPKDPVARAVKRALLNQARLTRRLDRLISHLETGVEQRVDELENPSFAAATPDVSLVLPVYNYEQYVGDTLGSIVESVGVRPEVIVVDDHSTDGSRAIVESFVDTHPELPAKLIVLSANQGLSAVRNLALEHVRAPYVFFIDADNQVYPRALAKLKHALDSSDAAFAYGIIECFGDDERLVSTFPWDVDRLVYGNYIDAMVMLRTSVLREVGGFSLVMQNQHGGWEDYEMWLRLADRGARGVLVPEIVARYRVHGASMVGTVNLDAGAAYQYLRGLYPALPWPPEDTDDDAVAATPGGRRRAVRTPR
jgi:GT2 family glycosyltransferase